MSSIIVSAKRRRATFDKEDSQIQSLSLPIHSVNRNFSSLSIPANERADVTVAIASFLGAVHLDSGRVP